MGILDVLSAVSSIITCILFIFYIIGHCLKIVVKKNTIYVKFEIVYCSPEELECVDNLISLSDDGEIFKISSLFNKI